LEQVALVQHQLFQAPLVLQVFMEWSLLVVVVVVQVAEQMLL